MGRTYVAIYQNRNSNDFVYFDYNKHEFFTFSQGNNVKIFASTAFAGVVFYAIMKNISFGIAINPLIMMFVASVIGIILGYISIILTNKLIERKIEHSKEIMHPTHKELRDYLFEGKKQFFILIFAILLAIFFIFISGIFLFFNPQDVMMFLVNIIGWMLSILITWAVRPIKRYQIHKQLKIELEQSFD